MIQALFTEKGKKNTLS